MQYNQALAKIHSFNKFGTRFGLERVSALLSLLGNPHKNLRFIHIAGTNGKGSVSKMLAEIFAVKGDKVGLYTSPYVVDFRERMQINGEMIAKEELSDLAWEVLETAKKMEDTPTEFEVVTAIAMLYFSRNDCDIVVLEVGLGGVYDATNVIDTPLVSVITSISLDHTQYLGNTLSSVAENKAGIIKPGGKTVLAYGQAEEVIAVVRRHCEQKANELFVCQNKTRSYNGKAFFYKERLFELSMLGFHQMQNAVTAIETARLLGVPDTIIFKGVKKAVMPARMELVSRNPVVIIDGAHNPDGVEMLCKTVRHFFSEKKIIVVMAMMADKEWKESALKIETIASEIIATRASNPRSLEPLEIANFLHCEACEDSFEAYLKAKQKADENSIILISGSLYLAGDLREKVLNEREARHN